MLVRFLAILFLVASGVPRLGAIGTVISPTCKISSVVADDGGEGCCSGGAHFCEMSNGPCRCVAAPAPTETPDREAPLPTTERESFSGFMSEGFAEIRVVEEPERLPTIDGPLVWALLSDRSHNELQAFLGIWRT